MTPNTKAFDTWIRHDFVKHNTQLEELYASQPDPALVTGVGDDLKTKLVEEGRSLIVPLLSEGNTDEGFDSGFDLLGNVGLYMAACRRHEITEPSRETTSPLKEASALALQLGASLGVTPRFATSHLSTHNRAVNGVYKRFTSLDAEKFFLEYNTRGIFAYKRAADALVRILHLGVSHPVTFDLLEASRHALSDVMAFNHKLFEHLDRDAFFYSVRPYYKPFRVGQHEYRGANAGDFAGINEIDLLLGLCSADNTSYSQLLVDKFLYMMPEDQARLRDVMRRQSLMDQFIESFQHGTSDVLRNNLSVFLEVCRLHGEAAAQHHHQLVKKYIEQPSKDLDAAHLKHITASGPPLEVLLRALEKLCDLRCAAPRDDIPTRYADIQSLKAHLN